MCGRPGGPSSGSSRPGPRSGAGAERRPRARTPVRAPPVLCLASGCGDHGRVGPPEACVGPGRAGVGGGPPGPPMGSGCRCGGATSRRRTPSWTPSSASLRARVSGGGGGRGGGSGGGPSSPECEWGGRAQAVCVLPVSLWGLVTPRHWPGVAGARRGAGGRGLGANGPGVGERGRKLSLGFRDRGVCVCDNLSVQGREVGWECAGIRNSGCLDVSGAVWMQERENVYGPNWGPLRVPCMCPSRLCCRRLKGKRVGSVPNPLLGVCGVSVCHPCV